MISPITWLWNIRHGKLLERTRRTIDTLILINNIKRKQCCYYLCRYLKKVVARVEG
jgi:hypothetical protein